MKDLMKVRLGITHAGTFHTDDVLSTVLLTELNPDIKIERAKQYEADDSIEDILAYDIGFGEFDHHSADNGYDEFGNHLSALGKLWNAYGKMYLKRKGFTRIEAAFKKFKRNYISKVNQGDNGGYKDVFNFSENLLIIRFNPTWYEVKDNPNAGDEQFFKAVEFARFLFENWTREVYESIELRSTEEGIWKEALTNSDDGIVILKENIPWKCYIRKYDDYDVKIVISKSKRGGFSITSKDSQIFPIKDSEYLTFRHPSQFMGVASSLDNAIMAARCSIA